MQTHQPGDATRAMEIALLVCRKHKPEGLRVFETLCVSTDPDGGPIDAAVTALKRAGFANNALKILKRAAGSGSCNPQVGPAAVGLLLFRMRVLAATWFFARLKAGEIQRRAAASLIDGLSQLGAGAPFQGVHGDLLTTFGSRLAIRWLLWRRRDALAADDDLWGHVGYVLANSNRMEQVVRWLADWPSHRDVQPWMLFNLCLAQRHMGRYPESTAVARHVLKTWEHHEDSLSLLLFIAVEEALSGSLETAVESLQRVTLRKNVDYDQQLLALANALVEFRQKPMQERRAHFTIVRRQLEQRFSSEKLARAGKDVRRTFHRAGKVFARTGAGWPARLWFAWKLTSSLPVVG